MIKAEFTPAQHVVCCLQHVACCRQQNCCMDEQHVVGNKQLVARNMLRWCKRGFIVLLVRHSIALQLSFTVVVSVSNVEN